MSADIPDLASTGPDPTEILPRTGEAKDRYDRNPGVSVVILSKDEPELSHTLEILAPQCRRAGAECVVVDASSGRLESIRVANPWVRWIDYTPPLGAASTIPEQRNLGVRAASGEVVAFCDSGGMPCEGWLEALTEPIISGELQVTCGPVASVRPGVYRTMNDLPDRTPVDSVPTANLAFSRTAFDSVGGFDERYAYGSDIDFAWRLIKAGTTPVVVRSARMGMDWGPWDLQKRRSWRYGRARARMLRFHPDRRVRTMLKHPELVAYPGLTLTLPMVLLAAARRRFLPVAAWSTLLVVLRIRNRNAPRPWAVLSGHVIYGAAFWWELLTAKVRRLPPVLHLPRDSGPYHDLLLPALERAGVRSGFIHGPSGSKTLNVALLPLRMPICRLRGARVVHLHWVWVFDLPWARRSRLARRALRWWFSVTLWAVDRCGLALVWTAHNTLPHTPVFDEDVKARRVLARRAASIIAHSDRTASEIRTRFGASRVDVAPLGPYPLPRADRDASRRALEVADTDLVVVMFGNVAPYKGFDTMLEAASLLEGDLSHRLVLVLAGECRDEDLRRRVERTTRAARINGVRVVSELRRLDDEELGELLAAADVCAFPFERITTSGSVLTALTAGRPALVSDIEGFDDLPDAAVLRHAPGVEGAREGLLRLGELSTQHLAQMGEAAARSAASRTWEAGARVMRDAYRRALQGGNDRG